MSTRGRRTNIIEIEEDEPVPQRTAQRRQKDGETSQKRRRRDEESSEEEDGETEVYGSAGKANQAERAAQRLSAEELERKVKDLVRLALCSEYRKTPIRRDDIVKRVLQQEHSRTFPHVFEKAQQRLADVFGMKMVELPIREKKVAAGSTANRRAAVNKEKTTTSKAYILQNILSQRLQSTNLVAWGDQPGMVMGLATAILSIIFVNGRVLADGPLMHYLRRLKLVDSDNTTQFGGDIDKVLAGFVKQGYLDRQKTGLGGGGVGDGGNNIDMERESFEYRWGPRAKLEIPEKYMVNFIKEVYGNDASEALVKSIENASEGEVRP